VSALAAVREKCLELAVRLAAVGPHTEAQAAALDAAFETLREIAALAKDGSETEESLLDS
jgi:hypothetical protein